MSVLLNPNNSFKINIERFFTHFTFGGLKGYVSGILISRINFPPSYAVSGGPTISPRSSV